MDSDYSEVFDSSVQMLKDDANDYYAYTEVYDAIHTKNASQKNHDYVNVSFMNQIDVQGSSSTQIDDSYEIEMLGTLRELDEMLDKEAMKFQPQTPTYVNVDNFGKYPKNDSYLRNKPLYRIDVPSKSSINAYRHNTGDQYNMINFPQYQAPNPNPLSRYPLIKQLQPFSESNFDIFLPRSDQNLNNVKIGKSDVTRSSRSVSFTSKKDLEKSRIKHLHELSITPETKQGKDNFKSKLSKLFNFLKKSSNKNSPETKQAGQIRIGGVGYDNFDATSYLMQSSTPHLFSHDYSSSSNDLRDSNRKHVYLKESKDQDYYQLPRYLSENNFASQQRINKSHLIPSCISVTKSPVFKSSGNKGVLYLNQTQKKPRSEKQKMHEYLHPKNKISEKQPNPNFTKKSPLPSKDYLYRITKSVEEGIEQKIHRLGSESLYFCPKCSSTDTNIYSNPSSKIQKCQPSNGSRMQKISHKNHESNENLHNDSVVRPKTKLGGSSLVKNSTSSETQEEKTSKAFIDI